MSDDPGALHRGTVAIYTRCSPNIVCGQFKLELSFALFSPSDFHQESWCPTWSISTILTGLLSFMNETNTRTYGSLESTDEEKKRLARESLKFNVSNPQFVELFPELTKEINEILDRLAKERPTKRKKETAANDSAPNLVNGEKILQSVFLNLMLVVVFIVVIFLLKYAISLTA